LKTQHDASSKSEKMSDDLVNKKWFVVFIEIFMLQKYIFLLRRANLCNTFKHLVILTLRSLDLRLTPPSKAVGKTFESLKFEIKKSQKLHLLTKTAIY